MIVSLGLAGTRRVATVLAGTVALAATSAAACGTTHVVAAGESLSVIARAHYGSTSAYHRIYEQNRAVIGSNPDMIHIGMTLQVPCADIGAGVAAAVQPVQPLAAAPGLAGGFDGGLDGGLDAG
ncbi:MAG: LysM peptidoglycan-binding domain-containing protein, partial [Pseudomonadota bacterium]